MELTPGRWDFGPAQRAADRLADGEPDEIDFSLIVDDGGIVWLEPASTRVRLDDEPVAARVAVGTRIIGAGASRFAISRSGGEFSSDLASGRTMSLHPWVTDPTPEPVSGGRGGFAVEDLVALRRRLHPGIVEVRRTLGSQNGPRWLRRPGDTQFGLATVGVADLAVDLTGRGERRVRGPLAAVPLSVDLVSQPTVVIGSRRQQLALVAQIVLNAAATTHPHDLQFGLDSDRADLSFVRDLPHWAGGSIGREAALPRTVLIVDRTRQASGRPRTRWPRPTQGGSLLVLGRRGDPIPPIANVLTIGSNGTMAVHAPQPGSDAIRMTAGVTPTGVSPLMARELTDRLARLRLHS
jgi:hypothetical protein